MTTDYWQLTLSFVGISGGLLMMLSMLLLRLTLDPRVRKTLPKNKIYDSFFDVYFGFGRSIAFGWACVFSYFNNSPKLRYAYNDFDIKSFANRFEKVTAYCMVFGGFILVVCVAIVFVTKWLGIFEWN